MADSKKLKSSEIKEIFKSYKKADSWETEEAAKKAHPDKEFRCIRRAGGARWYMKMPRVAHKKEDKTEEKKKKASKSKEKEDVPVGGGVHDDAYDDEPETPKTTTRAVRPRPDAPATRNKIAKNRLTEDEMKLVQLLRQATMKHEEDEEDE